MINLERTPTEIRSAHKSQLLNLIALEADERLTPTSGEGLWQFGLRVPCVLLSSLFDCGLFSQSVGEGHKE